MDKLRIVSLVTQAGKGGIEVVSSINNRAKIVFLNEKPSNWNFLSTQYGILFKPIKVYKILLSHDIILTNLPIHHLFVSFLSQFTKTRHIAVEHGPWILAIRDKGTIFAQIAYMIWLRKSKTTLVTVSLDLLSIYNIYRKNNHYIPNTFVKPAIDDSLRKENKMTKVFFAGRLDYQKDIFLAINSFIIYNQANPNSSLDIYGSGPQEDDLRLFLSKMSLPVTIKGFQANARDSFKEYDICLVTSKYEGLPGIVLESLYAGCMVVCPPFCTGLLELSKIDSLLIAESRCPKKIATLLSFSVSVKYDINRIRSTLDDFYSKIRVERMYDDLFYQIYE